MRQIVGLMMAVLLLAACGGGRRMSPEELQHKLDSVKALEIKEKLALQGVNLEASDNPLKLFYDSLEIQSLPISYSEDYVNFLPAFKDVTPEIVSYMELVECKHPKAVALPGTILFGSIRSTMIMCLWISCASMPSMILIPRMSSISAKNSSCSISPSRATMRSV